MAVHFRPFGKPGHRFIDFADKIQYLAASSPSGFAALQFQLTNLNRCIEKLIIHNSISLYRLSTL